MRTLLIPLLMGVLAFGTAGAVSASAAPAAGGSSARSIDLGSLLASNGTFSAGSQNGTVSLAGWQMASDYSAGEAPRFSPSSTTSPAALEVAAWSALGSNGAGEGALNSTVVSLAVLNGDLYVGGYFTDAAGIATADFIARWNGSQWFALGSNGAGNGALNSTVNEIAVQGTSIIVGGQFINAAGIATADYVAKWNGTAWSALGSNGAGNGAINNQVRAVAASATDVFVAGDFSNAGNVATADYVARFSSGAWSGLGSNGAGEGALGGGSSVWSIAYQSTAGGFNVYVGGLYNNAAGIGAADNIARWDGSSWHSLGSNGLGNTAVNNLVSAITVSGGNVYIGGTFNDVAAIDTADHLARWDGAWHGVGSNGAGDGALGDTVFTIVVSGSELFVGGDFSNAAGIAEADHVARFAGGNWSAVGGNGGGVGVVSGDAFALAIANNNLYAGGNFFNIDPANLADFVAAYGPLTTASYQPDGRIKKGSGGTLAGNNVYNLDGTNQARSATKATGTSVTFYVNIQNDGNAADTFKVSGAGSNTMYNVRYYRGSTEITTAVVAGTYQTTSLAPAATHQIKAVVKVKAAATVGSSVTRLVTVTSVADPAKKDAVKFTVKRS